MRLISFDLNSADSLSCCPRLNALKGIADAHQTLCLRTTHELPAQKPSWSLHRAILMQSPVSQLLLSRPIHVTDLRSIDYSREPTRHRDLPARDPQKALPGRLQRVVRPERNGRRHRATRLALLYRSDASLDRALASAAAGRGHRRRVRADHLCSGFYHDRPVLGAVPLGSISSSQESRQAAIAIGPGRRCPCSRADFRRQAPRRNRPRRPPDRGPVLCTTIWLTSGREWDHDFLYG